MKKEWDPSTWGRKLTRSPDWRLFLEGLKLSLTVDGKTHAVTTSRRHEEMAVVEFASTVPFLGPVHILTSGPKAQASTAKAR